MIIKGYEETVETIQHTDELQTMLFQTVLSVVDEEVRVESSKLDQLKTTLKVYHKALKNNKKNLTDLAREYKRLQLLDELLSKINTLKKEGVLVGKNKDKIKNVLAEIEQKQIWQLENVLEKLSIYTTPVSETPDKVIF